MAQAMQNWAFSSGRAQRWQLLCIHGNASLQAAQIAACEGSSEPLQRLHDADEIFFNKRFSQAACARITVALQCGVLRPVFWRFEAVLVVPSVLSSAGTSTVVPSDPVAVTCG